MIGIGTGANIARAIAHEAAHEVAPAEHAAPKLEPMTKREIRGLIGAGVASSVITIGAALLTRPSHGQ